MGNIGNLEKGNLTPEAHFRPFFLSFLESVRNERNGKIGKNLTIGKEIWTLKTVQARPFLKFFPDFSAVSPEGNVRFREILISFSDLTSRSRGP